MAQNGDLMPINPTSALAFYDLQTSLANCILAELDPRPARICRNAAGIVGWNNCCGCNDGDPSATCGQLVVSWQRDFYSNDGRDEVNFINDDTACPENLLIGAEFIVNVMRCATAVQEDGTAPDCAVVALEARQVRLDVSAVRRGVICCLNALVESDGLMGYQLLPTIAAGAGGGCIGSDTVVRLYLPNCVTCD